MRDFQNAQPDDERVVEKVRKRERKEKKQESRALFGKEEMMRSLFSHYLSDGLRCDRKYEEGSSSSSSRKSGSRWKEFLVFWFLVFGFLVAISLSFSFSLVLCLSLYHQSFLGRKKHADASSLATSRMRGGKPFQNCVLVVINLLPSSSLDSFFARDILETKALDRDVRTRL